MQQPLAALFKCSQLVQQTVGLVLRPLEKDIERVQLVVVVDACDFGFHKSTIAGRGAISLQNGVGSDGLQKLRRKGCCCGWSDCGHLILLVLF